MKSVISFLDFSEDQCALLVSTYLVGNFLGSEIYQEHLVKGLAHQLQVNLLVFDSTQVSLEVWLK